MSIFDFFKKSAKDESTVAATAQFAGEMLMVAAIVLTLRKHTSVNNRL